MAEVLEYGNIYFAFRPKVEERTPEGIEDVQRFYMILNPDGGRKHRLVVIGRKKLPEIEDGGEKYWGFVETVGRTPKQVEDALGREVYRTKTRGERHVPAARPAGEGVYAIARHGDHTHLAYRLELPEHPGAVQRELNIDERASYVVSIGNPERPAPKGAGMGEKQEAHYPKRLRAKFEGRKFIAADPPDFLDHEGAELLLIGASERPTKELGIELHAEEEDAHSADIFDTLERGEHPTRPLFEGKWD